MSQYQRCKQHLKNMFCQSKFYTKKLQEAKLYQWLRFLVFSYYQALYIKRAPMRVDSFFLHVSQLKIKNVWRWSWLLTQQLVHLSKVQLLLLLRKLHFSLNEMICFRNGKSCVVLVNHITWYCVFHVDQCQSYFYLH